MNTNPLTVQSLQAAALLTATSQVFVMDEDEVTPDAIVDQLKAALQNPELLTFSVREQYEHDDAETLLSLIKDIQECAISTFTPYTTN